MAQWSYVPNHEGATGITMTAATYTPTRWARHLALMLAVLGGSILTSQTAFAVDFVVNTANDTIDADLNNATCADQSGKCSLRAAIMQANKTSGGTDTITIPAGLGPYTLSIVGRNENAAATGDLDITDSVIIASSGGYATISAGTPPTPPNVDTRDRVFHIASGNPTVTFTGLIITDGLTVEDSNAAFFNGAGVMIDSGTVTISDCRIQNNHVTGTTADFFTTLGGGIHVGTDGTLTLSNSTVSSNSALAGGGLSNQGTANIRSNTFITNNNAASGGGGGIANLGGYLNVGQATIDQNKANLGGGIYNAPQKGNNGSANIVGAAIEYNVAKALSGEVGGLGGGIYNLGPMVIQRSAINNNETANAATPSTGVGADAGGIYNSGLGNIDIANVTISTNKARGGGGIFTTRNVTLTNVTIFNNKAEPCTLGVGGCDARGAIGGNQLSAYFSDPDNNAANRPDVVISNTILADGSYSNASGNGVCAGSTGYADYITSNGYNISGDASCDLIAASDRTNLNNNTNPSLAGYLGIDESLQVNNAPPGTTTKTHQIFAGSPARDGIPGNVANPCPLIDQRNLLRGSSGALGDVCDIGAYEYNAGTAASNSYVDLKTTVTDRYDPATAGQQNTYTITVTNLYDSVDVSSVTLTINVPAQLQLNTVKPANTCSFANYTLTCPLGLIAAQDKKQIFIDVTPLVAGTVTVTADAAVTELGKIDAFIANNTASQSTEIKGAENGSTNFSGTGGGGGAIGALLWIAAAGWSWRRFSAKQH